MNASPMPNKSVFRPRARLLQLLGDQLIGSPRLAVFELVKNAYDADARLVTVTLIGLNGDDEEIRVEDDGVGMTRDTIDNIWLVPGHDHKGVQKSLGQRSGLGRLPLGDKGLGRFAVHKLGNRIRMVTRAAGSQECVVDIDWEKLTQHEFLDDAVVSVIERTPKVFTGDATGTRVTVSELRGEDWTRGEVRRLARQIGSISSPWTAKKSDMVAKLKVPGNDKWLEGLPNTATIREAAFWVFEFEIIKNVFSWTMEYRGVPNTKSEKRSASASRNGVLIATPRASGDDDILVVDQAGTPVPSETHRKRRAAVTTVEDLKNIGPIRGRFYVFDREEDVVVASGISNDVLKYLDENGGVRVYRDGIRVYNYGEKDDDWLGLDPRRVNTPSKRISRNLVLGEINLELASSATLVEKTNREGFVESPTFERLRSTVLGVVSVLEGERNFDKDALRKLMGKKRDESGRDIRGPLEEIRKIAAKNGFEGVVQQYIAKAQNSYDGMRDIMLRSGVSSMTLVIVFHEIDHGVRMLGRNAEAGIAPELLARQAQELLTVLDGYGDLLRRGSAKTVPLATVIRRTIALNTVRLRTHGIEVEIGYPLGDPPAASARFPIGLLLGAITNLIDNSIYWMQTNRPDASAGDATRRLYLGIDETTFEEGPAIIIADSGPGFEDQIGDVTAPFFSRRPAGIGIGLYYVNLIMEVNGGSLRMPPPGEVELPTGYTGAVLALVFKKE